MNMMSVKEYYLEGKLMELKNTTMDALDNLAKLEELLIKIREGLKEQIEEVSSDADTKN